MTQDSREQFEKTFWDIHSDQDFDELDRKVMFKHNGSFYTHNTTHDAWIVWQARDAEITQLQAVVDWWRRMFPSITPNVKDEYENIYYKCEQLQAQLAALDALIAKKDEALTALIETKKYKDEIGKDLTYLNLRLKAWQLAGQALALKKKSE